MRHATVKRGGGAGSGMWAKNGVVGEGVFQRVSHCVKTDVDGNIKAKHGRHHTTKLHCEANVTHSRAPSQMYCFWI